MINRVSCYDALFRLKQAGINVDDALEAMKNSSGVPREVIVFLRDNSPQFQFYRYIQKYQKALAENILDYKKLSDQDKLITCCSFLTRVLLAVKYKNLGEGLVDDLNINEISDAINTAITEFDYSKVDKVLSKHHDSLEVFYINRPKDEVADK